VLTFIIGYQLQFVSLFAYGMGVTASVTNLTHYATVASSNDSAKIYTLIYYVLFCDTTSAPNNLYISVSTITIYNSSNGSLWSTNLQDYQNSTVIYGINALGGPKYTSWSKWGW
jgi:hypothetical protein